jgi:thioredoxin-like negative regulator of GroEL
MKLICTLLCIATWIAITMPAATSSTINNVVQLTETTFNEYIATNKLVMVMFTEPACGHCTKVLPIYEEAAAQLKKKNSPAMLAKFDGDEHTAIAKKYKIDRK